MTEFFNEEETNLSYKRIPNNAWRYSRRWKVNPPVPSPLSLESGLPLVTCFQRVKYGKEGSYFTVENPDKHSLSQVIKINIIGDKSLWQYVALI